MVIISGTLNLCVCVDPYSHLVPLLSAWRTYFNVSHTVSLLQDFAFLEKKKTFFTLHIKFYITVSIHRKIVKIGGRWDRKREKLALRGYHLSCTSYSPENTFQTQYMGMTVERKGRLQKWLGSACDRNCGLAAKWLWWWWAYPSMSCQENMNHFGFLSQEEFSSRY